MADENIKCPKCGSKDVDRHWGDKLLKGGANFVGSIIENYVFGSSGDIGGEIAEGIADEISQNYVCKKCGHNFTKEDNNKTSSNSRSTSNNNSYSGNSNKSGPFNSSYQNALYNELRSLSSEKGGFTNVDYSLIVNLGNSYGLSKEQIYDVAMKCMWKNGAKPSMTGLIGNSSSTNTTTNNITKPSKNFKKFSKDVYMLWDHLTYKEIVSRGLGEGLTEDEIFSLIKSNAIRKNIKVPTKEELFGSKYISTNNNIPSNEIKDPFLFSRKSYAPNKNQRKLEKDLIDNRDRWNCNFRYVVERGIHYKLTEDEIYEVLTNLRNNSSGGSIYFSDYQPESRSTIFRGYKIPKSYGKVNGENNTSDDQNIKTSTGDVKNSAQHSFSSSNNQNAFYQELYALSSEKGGFSQADFDLIAKMGNSYNLTQDEIFQVAQKCLWKSWISLTKDQLFKSTLERSATSQSTPNKELVKKREVIDNEKEYLDELRSIYTEQSEITERERRLLNRLSKSLGISDERAKELEDQMNPNTLSDKEQEYAEEIKACLEDDGVISDRERRILNRLATSLDITPERAEEIEKIIISRNK